MSTDGKWRKPERKKSFDKHIYSIEYSIHVYSASEYPYEIDEIFGWRDFSGELSHQIDWLIPGAEVHISDIEVTRGSTIVLSQLHILVPLSFIAAIAAVKGIVEFKKLAEETGEIVEVAVKTAVTKVYRAEFDQIRMILVPIGVQQIGRMQFNDHLKMAKVLARSGTLGGGVFESLLKAGKFFVGLCTIGLVSAIILLALLIGGESIIKQYDRISNSLSHPALKEEAAPLRLPAAAPEKAER